MSRDLEQRAATANPGAGRLGWTLRRIEPTGKPRDGQRRLKAAGLAVRYPGLAGDTGGKTRRFPKRRPPTATDPHPSITGAVSTDAVSGRAPSASACEPSRERSTATDPGAQRRRQIPGPRAAAVVRQLCECPPLRAAPASSRSVEARVVFTIGARRARLRMAAVRWSATRTRAATGGHDFLPSPWAIRARPPALVWWSTTRSGPSCTTGVSPPGRSVRCRRPRRYARGCSPRTSRPDHDSSLPGVLALDGVLACRAVSATRISGHGRSPYRPRFEDPAQGRRSAIECASAPRHMLDRWATRWADTRIHGTTNRQVAAMFAEERPGALGRSRSSRFATPPRRPDRGPRRRRARRSPACLQCSARNGSGSACTVSGRGPGAAPGPHHRGAPPGASPLAPRLAIGSTTRTGRPGRPAPPARCSARHAGRVGISTLCEHLCQRRGRDGHPANPRRAQGVMRSPGRVHRRRTPPLAAWTSACPPPAFCGALSTAAGRSTFRCARDPLSGRLTPTAMLIDPQDWRHQRIRRTRRPPPPPPLRHGRCLEARLRHAQPSV